MKNPVAVDRRNLMRGAAWAAPTVALSAAAPALAASPPPCIATVDLGSATVGNGSLTFDAVTPEGRTFTMSIESTLAADTTTFLDSPTSEETDQSFNLSQSGSGWNGGSDDCGANDYVFEDFGEPDAIVLNQRRVSEFDGDTCSPTATGSPEQTLTFRFFDEGVEFSPAEFTITVFDISSVSVPVEEMVSWRLNYWDAVGFSVTPDSIQSAEGLDAGMGSGTLEDPFKRSDPWLSTGAGPFSDIFHFSDFRSGSQMLYTQHAGYQGWQFASISDISFGVTC